MPASSHNGAPAGVPAQLGEFRILDVLGEGGSGIVYTALWGHRQVALKVLHPSLVASPSERERFFAEARLLADITHRGVVKVLSFGTLPDGRPYLAMEKLVGESLATRLTRGRLTLGESFNVFGQLVSAVAELHQRGLVHRDLKPENVMLVNGGRFAVLLDFGIAKPLDSPASTVTRAGGVRGTPAYMAPERFFGSPASPASDIYELAVVKYAMLVGRLPWNVFTDPEARLNPAPPSSFGVKLPGTLETALLAALSTRPDKRPPSAAALLQRLQLAVEGKGPSRQTADLGSGSAAPPAAPATTPGHQKVSAEYARTVIASTAARPAPAAQQHRPAPAAQPVAPRPVAHQHAAVPAPHQPAGHHRPGQPPAATTTQNVHGRAPVWPTVMVAGSILILAAALLIVFWPRGSASPASAAKQPAKNTEPKTKKAESPSKKAAKSPGAELTDKLAKALLTSSGSHTRPRPSGPPPTDMRYMPAAADIMVSARVKDLAHGTAVSSLLSKLQENKRFKELFAMAKKCNIDLLDTAERVTLATTDKSDAAFDIILSGTWTRDRVETCLKKNHPDMTIQRSDAVSKLARPKATEWIAWLDEHTLLYSNRKQVNEAWMRKRLAKQSSFRDKHDRDGVLARVDQHADVWIAGSADAASDKPLLEGAPKPKLLLVHAYIARDIKGKAWLVYDTAKNASVAAAKMKAEITKLKSDDGGMLFDRFRSRLEGKSVAVEGEINSLVAALGVGAIATAIESADKDSAKPAHK